MKRNYYSHQCLTLDILNINSPTEHRTSLGYLVFYNILLFGFCKKTEKTERKWNNNILCVSEVSFVDWIINSFSVLSSFSTAKLYDSPRQSFVSFTPMPAKGLCIQYLPLIDCLLSRRRCCEDLMSIRAWTEWQRRAFSLASVRSGYVYAMPAAIGIRTEVPGAGICQAPRRPYLFRQPDIGLEMMQT